MIICEIYDSFKYEHDDKYIIKAGRNARQKARKLAKLNLDTRIAVVSKRGVVQYAVTVGKYYEMECWIYNKEVIMVRDHKHKEY
jgi:hypothetical protein